MEIITTFIDEVIALVPKINNSMANMDKEQSQTYLLEAIGILMQNANNTALGIDFNKVLGDMKRKLEIVNKWPDKPKGKGGATKSGNNKSTGASPSKGVDENKGQTSGKAPQIEEPEKEDVNELGLTEEEQKYVIASKPDVSFKHLAGMDILKTQITQALKWPLTYATKMEEMGLKPPKGILLLGPPGCGKTYIVKCSAGEFACNLLAADASSVMGKYVGESEKAIHYIFSAGSKLAPSIIFFDEIDKLLPVQSEGSSEGSGVGRRVENQFLQEMDGINSKQGYIVLFATNEPWNINPAIIRPGRVDYIIYVGPPDLDARKKMIELNLKKVQKADDLDLEWMANLTNPDESGSYYSSSGMAVICQTAMRELFKLRIDQENDSLPLTKELWLKAVQQIPRSIPKGMIDQYLKWAEKNASNLS